MSEDIKMLVLAMQFSRGNSQRHPPSRAADGGCVSAAEAAAPSKRKRRMPALDAGLRLCTGQDADGRASRDV